MEKIKKFEKYTRKVIPEYIKTRNSLIKFISTLPDVKTEVNTIKDVENVYKRIKDYAESYMDDEETIAGYFKLRHYRTTPWYIYVIRLLKKYNDIQLGLKSDRFDK